MTPWEAAARNFEDDGSHWTTPGKMAASLDPSTRQTPALDLIDVV